MGWSLRETFALEGDIQALEAAYSLGGLPLMEELCECATMGSQLEALLWLLALDPKSTADRVMRQRPCPIEVQSCFKQAAKHGHLEMMKWLLAWAKAGCPWDQRIAYLAAQAPGQEALMWLLEEGCPWDFNAFYQAARMGHMTTLEWMHATGTLEPYRWEDAFQYPAQTGRLDVRWIRDRTECLPGGFAFSAAVYFGDIRVMEWMVSLFPHPSQCPWSMSCCDAARRGRLDVLKWLRSHGCPWDEHACIAPAGAGQLEVLKWLRAEDEESQRDRAARRPT